MDLVTAVDFEALANEVSYVASPEHKRLPSPLAEPKLRTDASACDDVDRELAERSPRYPEHLLRAAIRRGQVSKWIDGVRFPRYVHGWARLGSSRDARRALFRGSLTNRELGQYKGYWDDLDSVYDNRVRRNLEAGGDWSTEIAESELP
jgi:hypothetical protein